MPEDISVIGIDDHPMGTLLDLTTVAQPVQEQGDMAGQMVVDLLAGEDIGGGRSVGTRLVVQGTTARPRDEQHHDTVVEQAHKTFKSPNPNHQLRIPSTRPTQSTSDRLMRLAIDLTERALTTSVRSDPRRLKW